MLSYLGFKVVSYDMQPPRFGMSMPFVVVNKNIKGQII